MVCGKLDNWAWKSRCRNCNAYPPAAHRDLLKNLSKGNNGGDKSGKGGGKSKGTGTGKNNNNIGTFAFRQIQQANSANKLQQTQSAYRNNVKELQDAKKRADSLQEANRKLQRELAEAKSTAAQIDGTDEMDYEGPEELDEEGRKARIEKIRCSLPYLEDQFGLESGIYKEAHDELESHQRALREAKPYKTHRTILERRVEKLTKLQERDRERLAELNEAAEEIKTKVAATTSAIAERERELETAEAELKDLVLRAVGEDQQTTSPPLPDPQQGWDAVVGTVATLVRQPGVPTQFTTQLEGLFGQLRTMVEALQQHAAANEAQAPAGAAAGGGGAASASSGQTDSATATVTDASTTDRWKQQRLARMQRRQTEAIAEFEREYRGAQLAAGAATANGGQINLSNQSASSAGGLAPATPTAQTQPQPADASATDSAAKAAAEAGADSSAGHAPSLAAAAPGGAADAAPNAEAAAAAAAPTSGEACLDPVAVLSDDESDVTGTLSDGERDQMDIEAVVERIPKAQREGIRAMLEKSKTRRARRMQRLKKPEAEIGGALRNPKK